MSDCFDDTLAAAAESFFLLPGAERVTYVPRSGLSRPIRAVVTRNPAAPLAGVAGGSGPALAVLVRNHATAGIASETIDTGGDTIRMQKQLGRPPKSVRLTEIINHDAGLMLIAAQ